ncbi:MAG TPA: ribosome small subunit-dependent GTPase A [Tissierellaceae bacterium]|nr:ribosome small subunit-dependent GTPase A [Tissierellaceae bacterium]
MVKGRIIKGVGGFYYVKTKDGIIESRARGVFREDKLKPLVGDRVKIKVSDEDNSGYIIEIEDRQTELLRPPVSNVTQAIIVMSIKSPDINTWLLDKFLLMADYEGLDILICINKCELDEEFAIKIEKIYKEAGYKVLLTSAALGLGIEELEEVLNGSISVLAGPSGVGKSSLLNRINPDFNLDTGDVSARTRRGRHTTRHVELLELKDNTFVLDSPGFSSLDLKFIENESQVRNYFKEINKYGFQCAFHSCLHDREPNCAVKAYVEAGKISQERYKNYLSILNEVRNIRRY